MQVVGGDIAFVDLADAKINDSQLTCVSGLENLGNLKLSNTSITDAGIVHIAGLANLVSLDLSQTEITDAGLKQLENLDSLQYLYLSGTQVKGEVIADDVVVNGRIVGRVRGLKVRLTATARVEGDIIHKTIAIESGAHFEGSVQRQDDPISGKSSAPAPAAQPGS